MTKRFGVFDKSNFKKPKIDNSVNNLWNNDDDIDECLVLATQVCEEENMIEIQNSSISNFPTYSRIFECDNDMCASTQILCNDAQLTHVEGNKTKQLEVQIKCLKERCKQKDGELSILHIQLEEMKLNLEQQYKKKEKEWQNKINLLDKKVLVFERQLDFKNVEMVTKGNKIPEILDKCIEKIGTNCDGTNSTSNAALGMYEKRKFQLNPILDGTTPMANYSNWSVWNEKHCDQKNRVGTSNYVNHVYVVPPEAKLPIVIKTNCVNFMTADGSLIQQVLATWRHALFFLHKYLLMLKHHKLISNDHYNVDMEHLKVDTLINSRLYWYNRETQMKACDTITIIAEMFPQNYDLQRSFFDSVNFDCLDNVLDIIKSILHMIKHNQTTGITSEFLFAATTLLFRICQTKYFLKSGIFVSNLLKAVLSAELSHNTLTILLLFFNQASWDSDFRQIVCKLTKPIITTNSNDNVSVTELCLLKSLAILCKNKIAEKEFPVILSMKGFQFTRILLNYDPLRLSSKKDNQCTCADDLSLSSIVIMGGLVKNYKRAVCWFPKGILQTHKMQFGHHGIITDKQHYSDTFKLCIKILYHMRFRYFDTVIKYLMDSQSEFIISYLNLYLDHLHLLKFEEKILHEMDDHEDVCDVNSAAFYNIPIWA